MIDLVYEIILASGNHQFAQSLPTNVCVINKITLYKSAVPVENKTLEGNCGRLKDEAEIEHHFLSIGTLSKEGDELDSQTCYDINHTEFQSENIFRSPFFCTDNPNTMRLIENSKNEIEIVEATFTYRF